MPVKVSENSERCLREDAGEAEAGAETMRCKVASYECLSDRVEEDRV